MIIAPYSSMLIFLRRKFRLLHYLTFIINTNKFHSPVHIAEILYYVDPFILNNALDPQYTIYIDIYIRSNCSTCTRNLDQPDRRRKVKL